MNQERVDCVVMYHGSCRLPVVGWTFWVHPLGFGNDCVFKQCGISFVRSARYPVWSQNEGVRLCHTSKPTQSKESEITSSYHVHDDYVEFGVLLFLMHFYFL